MEILVVVAITLVAAGIALPSFMRAMQGQRLRTAARTVVTSHKYARNMSVLRQQPMALLVDRINGEIEIVELANRHSANARDVFLSARAEGAKAFSRADEKAVDETEKVAPEIKTSEARPLDRGVKVAEFRSDGRVVSRDGVYWINYYASGMSDGFELTLRDERGREAKIRADSISGGIEVEYE